MIMKNKKLIFMVYTLSCFIAAGVCLIVDIAINRQITWAAYPLLSIAFGWTLLSSLLVKKHKIVSLLCALTLLILPYLYLLSKITPVTDWFLPIGLPSAIAGIIAMWILLPIYLFTKINILNKSAISVFLIGAVNVAVDYFTDTALGINPFGWERWLSIFGCIIAAAVLAILGYIKSKKIVEHKIFLKSSYS